MSLGLDIASASKGISRQLLFTSWTSRQTFPQPTARKGSIVNHCSIAESVFLFYGRGFGHGSPAQGCGEPAEGKA
jgi:hypothetical protein